MLIVHASGAAFPPAALRRLDAFYPLLQAALGGAAARLFGRDGLLPALVYLDCVLVALLAAEAALRRSGRRRALPFMPRRDWRAAWHKATAARPVVLILVRALPVGLAMAQVAQGWPAWAPNPQGLAGFAIFAFWFFLGPWERGSAAVDAQPAVNGQAAPEPKRNPP